MDGGADCCDKRTWHMPSLRRGPAPLLFGFIVIVPLAPLCYLSMYWQRGTFIVPTRPPSSSCRTIAGLCAFLLRPPGPPSSCRTFAGLCALPLRPPLARYCW